MGVEQTEIDALASLRPDLLRQIARDAIAPFYDHELDRRVAGARERVDREAHGDHQPGPGRRAPRPRSAPKPSGSSPRCGEQIAELNDQLRIDVDDFDLPPIVIPGAELNGNEPPDPLLDSCWPFAEQCRALIASKQYGATRDAT